MVEGEFDVFEFVVGGVASAEDEVDGFDGFGHDLGAASMLCALLLLYFPDVYLLLLQRKSSVKENLIVLFLKL